MLTPLCDCLIMIEVHWCTGNHTFEVSVEEREVNRQGTIGIALHVGSPGPDLSPEDVGGV